MPNTPQSDGPFRLDSQIQKSEDLPQFAAGQNKPGFFQSLPVGAKLGILLGTLALGISIYFVAMQNPATISANTGTNITLPVGKSVGWTTDFAGDIQGASKGRQLMLFRQSLNAVNYDFKFAGQIAEKSLGWVAHASDARNYYAMRIDVLVPGPTPKVSLYRYAVVDGQEGPHTQLPLPVTVRDSTVFRVQVHAQNGVLTTSIQDQVVDVWNDGRIHAGAAGFLSERGERSVIKEVDYTEKR